jgi:hypothetical protein
MGTIRLQYVVDDAGAVRVGTRVRALRQRDSHTAMAGENLESPGVTGSNPVSSTLFSQVNGIWRS